MAPTRYSVTDVVIETPRYGGVGGSVTSGAGGEHDILGHGWVEIEDGTMTIAVHPRGWSACWNPKSGVRISLMTSRLGEPPALR